MDTITPAMIKVNEIRVKENLKSMLREIRVSEKWNLGIIPSIYQLGDT